MNKRIYLLSIFLTALLATSLAAVELVTKNDDLKLSINGYGSFYFGQIPRGTGIESSGPVKNLWTDNILGGLSLEARYKENLKLRMGINAEMKFSWPLEMSYSQTKNAQPIAYIDEAYGAYSLNGNANRFNLCAGYFAYKYNPDVRNLGEFLFRSATYPASIRTDFDYPMARLLGFKISHSSMDSSFLQDLIISSETVFYPAMDWSLSYLFNYDFLNYGLLNFGAGVSMAHLLSVYDSSASTGSATSPKFYGAQGNQYITPEGDTAFYTFRGTKLMARLSIDPLAFIRENSTIFGESDLKLYAEMLIIGLKSYPDTNAFGKPNPSYSDWKEKTPITIGINLPTYKLLDIINLEFEYWGSVYYNDYRQIYVVDGKPTAPATNESVKESKWKWSLYLKRTFFNNHCSITTQFARDHMRLFDVLYDRANHREMLVEAGNWWWVTKFAFAF